MFQFCTVKSMHFGTIGDPPVQQYVQVDTRSSFTWVRARASDPYYYDPDATKTFKYIS